MKTLSGAMDLDRLCGIVSAGGVVVYPTETLWGIGGDARRPEVVARIREVKGISGGRPFPVLVDSVDRALAAVAGSVPGFEALARRFWPGSLTLAVPVVVKSLLIASGPFGTVGLRLSAEPVATRLAEAAGGFLVSTSANFTGVMPPSCLAEVDARLLALVDGRPLADVLCQGVPSTVLEFSKRRWVMRRAGAVPVDELAQEIPGLLELEKR